MDLGAGVPLLKLTDQDGEPVFINGDGETSRDCCFVDNAAG
jgi:hypothetical protein